MAGFANYRGGLIMPDYEIPTIERTLPSSLWSPLATHNYKRAIDVGESQLFQRNNADTYNDRIILCIAPIPYGKNQGSSDLEHTRMSYSAVGNMTTAGLPKNWSTINSANSQKALVDDFFRPIILIFLRGFQTHRQSPQQSNN